MAILNKFKNIFNKEGEGAQEKQVKTPSEDKTTKLADTKKEPSSKIKAKEGSLAYRVIAAPRITEKSAIGGENGKYTFRVFSDANKIEIKKAVESLYNVKVASVNIINVLGKSRRLGQKKGYKPGYKKAIVALKSGYKLDLLPH